MSSPTAKIDCYLDCVSPYSYFAMLYLLKNRDALLQHGVEVEFHPIFLGGINVGSGNKPPWTLPAKAAYSKYDSRRAEKYFGTKVETPSFFPILSLLPQRAMAFTKSRHPREKYEKAFLSLWDHMWKQGKDMSKPDLLATALSETFTEEEIKEIIAAAGQPKWKQFILDETNKCVAMGAFGAPWFWVTNKEGTGEPFFGSDRFHYMWDFLGVPCTHLTIIDKEKAKL